MSNLSILIKPEAVFADQPLSGKNDIFRFLSEAAQAVHGLDASLLAGKLKQRETLGSTGFGGGVALPHARLGGLDECAAIFLRLAKPVAFDAHDNLPVDLIFALFSPEQAGALHLKSLAEISRFMRSGAMLSNLRGASGPAALYALLTGVEARDAA